MHRKLSVPLVVVYLLFLSLPARAAEMNAEIQAGLFGGTLYQLSYALSEVLRRNVPDFKVTIVETQGSAGSLTKVMAEPKGRVAATTLISAFDAIAGHPPFKQPTDKLKILCCYAENVNAMIAVDPELKTLKDLAGKRIGLGPINNTPGRNTWSVISRGIPGSDKMKPFYMSWDQLRDALLDNSIDAMVMGVSTRPSGQWAPVAVYQEIAVSRPGVHFIPLTEEAVKEAAAADKLPYGAKAIPKGAIAENVPAVDTLAWSERLGLAAGADFPEETAYTLVKTFYEHFAEMVEFAPPARAVSQNLILPTDLPDKDIHPGTLKFMKEKGLR
jgi:TRAP transporter TAXI family solute receptor